MFNKTPLTQRNDPITRKDVKSVLTSPSSPGSVTSLNNTATSTPQNAQPAAEPPKLETPAAESPMGARLIVGPDVKLKGAEILDCDTLVVEGSVEATMDSRVIRIADNGAFTGKVSIDIAEIHGTFEGDLTARSQLIIHATGKVNGKIRYGKLVIDEGGELCGDIQALSSERANSVIRPSSGIPTLEAVAG